MTQALRQKFTDLLKGEKPMQQVQIRLPEHIRLLARKVATTASQANQKVYESDVYRAAITLFLTEYFTDSKE